MEKGRQLRFLQNLLQKEHSSRLCGSSRPTVAIEKGNLPNSKKVPKFFVLLVEGSGNYIQAIYKSVVHYRENLINYEVRASIQ